MLFSFNVIQQRNLFMSLITCMERLEEMTVGDLARTMPRINASLENRQAEYQTSMVEVEGMINQTPIGILIDPRASLSYIAPKIEEKCKLPVEKFENSWLVQLATGGKRKVT